MTTKRLSLSILAASLACVMLLGGCGLSSAIVEGLSEEHFIYAGTTPHDPESREFREVLSRDGLTLYVNDKTAEIAVRDTAGEMGAAMYPDIDVPVSYSHLTLPTIIVV